MVLCPIVFQAMKYNDVISEVYLDDNPGFSTVKQPFSFYVYFQAVRVKHL